MINSFLQRKLSVLSKQDKSSIGQWDKPILKLCDKINSLDNFYTTSSCSGRILLLEDNRKKGPGLFHWVSHTDINFSLFQKELLNISKKSLIFKQEPPIIHIACKNLEDANSLLKKALLSGFKRSGLISFPDRIVLEINSTDKIEFPISKNGNLLVSDEFFLKEVVKRANENLILGWKKIERLEKLL